ncbi:shikimate dehydrogenase [Mucilaginibacter hurinus]|uniref:Shikimate dehydrogenase n=1 Tax=Mucilaginibacter hurinus TaxID=2201324 RepID=A0A367GTK9_9SPHI|nr:shikimate dehydrogenase [Mucilaginibacter hurinus]RCH56754.1 shikimate dehydrogenase [Mucilaginibacter hurinus]
MRKFGLIGYPLSHSFSKKYFTEKFEKEGITDAVYELYPIEDIKTFSKFLHENPDLCGINVTIPYKLDVLEYIDWLDAEAKQVGAVNCIRIDKESPISVAFQGEVAFGGDDFRLEGFNTDVYGFEMSLRPLLKSHHKSALVLGDGGAAKAVYCVLDKLEMPYQKVTRRPLPGAILFNELTPELMADYTLIINTTPLGTYPNVEECPPILYDYITADHLLYDLIYNPEQTLFLKKGAEKGAATKNGLEMLILQAERSWEIWNSTERQS